MNKQEIIDAVISELESRYFLIPKIITDKNIVGKTNQFLDFTLCYVLDFYELPSEQFKSKKRDGKLVEARALFYLLCRDFGGPIITDEKVSAKTNRDRSTVIYHYNRLKDRMKIEQEYKERMNYIIQSYVNQLTQTFKNYEIKSNIYKAR